MISSFEIVKIDMYHFGSIMIKKTHNEECKNYKEEHASYLSVFVGQFLVQRADVFFVLHSKQGGIILVTTFWAHFSLHWALVRLFLIRFHMTLNITILYCSSNIYHI